jgi:tRNA (guanosine-2'-O-)-methyltransferase
MKSGMNDLAIQEHLVRYLENFILQSRVEVLKNNLFNRTRYITVVLEDIFQSHNASAIVRSCDCFGIQDIHIIETRNRYEPNKEIAMGAEQWLNMYKYNIGNDNTRSALTQLKSNGYRIVATTPHEKSCMINDFDIYKGKTAFVFGTERTGITDTVKEMADEFVKIPMYGFTESYNISVSVALLLQQITQKLRNSEVDWHIPSDEQTTIMLEWLRISIKKPHLLEKHFYENVLQNIEASKS